MDLESRGTVSQWYPEEGWGVIDCVDTPGGCWVHFSNITGEGSMFRSLIVGEEVEFTWEKAETDGFAFRAIRVGPPPPPAAAGAEEYTSSEAYGSTLTIVYGDPPDA